ncbi:heterokaryon incompatibility protein-domain-containing protein [Hypomontagnella monticulosa]|nr:heterokaryon incompatibility protein-domain-containing protein [Hypomontagnella monticulosa]
MLCDTCRNFCRDTLAGNLEGEGWCLSESRDDERMFIHGSAEQARRNAVSGCGLCSIVHAHYTDIEENNDFNDSELGSERGIEDLIRLSVSMNTGGHMMSRRPYWILFDYPHRKPMSLEFCFDSSEQSILTGVTNTDFVLGKDVEQHMGTVPKDYSGSSSVSTLTMLWSSKCRAEHAMCHRRKNIKPLPLRVIDVGEKDSDGTWTHPRLRVTDGQYGYYATLSYRWSEIGTQFCTTRKNFQDLTKFIPAWELPETVREAIIFCRSVGYRYLWVDSLCIIQGDDGDWNDACKQMGDIYENCDLNISALSSTDSYAGLFSYRRKPFKLNRVSIRLLDGRLLTLRVCDRRSELYGEARASPLSSRGWVLQERLLSPAIIHFGQECVYWECCSGTRTEFYANDERPGAGLVKNVAAESYRPGYINYPGGYFIAWYLIMTAYSAMNLTLESDRFPAILGLASRFRRMFSTTFLAGIWLEDLHRGLLWRALPLNPDPLRGKPTPRSDDDKSPGLRFPSWSWLARRKGYGVNFEMELAPGEMITVAHPVMRLINSRTDASFVSASVMHRPEIHRGDIRGKLQLWGIAMRVRIRAVYRDGLWKCSIQKWVPILPVIWPSQRHRKGIRRLRQSAPSKAKTGDITTLDCFMDNPVQAVLEGGEWYCLIIADWRYEYSFKHLLRLADDEFKLPQNLRCYLLLQRVRPLRSGQHPSDLGIFKRIGIGMAGIDAVDAFFGAANESRRFLKII